MKNIKLTCTSIWFYSSLDKHNFFQWLQSITSITHYDGANDELYLYYNSNTISDQDLREILSLFYRYKIDMKQLVVFLNNKNKKWFFDSPKGYWHRKVFGTTTIKKKKTKKNIKK